LEHIVDVATAFKRAWILAVFLRSNDNRFRETKLCDASSLDPTIWFEMPEANAGVRAEIVSLEPVILLRLPGRAGAY